MPASFRLLRDSSGLALAPVMVAIVAATVLMIGGANYVVYSGEGAILLRASGARNALNSKIESTLQMCSALRASANPSLNSNFTACTGRPSSGYCAASLTPNWQPLDLYAPVPGAGGAQIKLTNTRYRLDGTPCSAFTSAVGNNNTSCPIEVTAEFAPVACQGPGCVRATSMQIRYNIAQAQSSALLPGGLIASAGYAGMMKRRTQTLMLYTAPCASGICPFICQF